MRLDAGSEWADVTLARLYVRQGDMAQAKAFKLGQNPRSRILSACVHNEAPSTISHLAAELSPDALSIPDPEVSYVLAFDYSYCGQNDIAIKLLRKSVAGPYCAATGMQRDPGLAKLRTLPEYSGIFAEATRCRDNFLSQRDLRPPTATTTPPPTR